LPPQATPRGVYPKGVDRRYAHLHCSLSTPARARRRFAQALLVGGTATGDGSPTGSRTQPTQDPSRWLREPSARTCCPAPVAFCGVSPSVWGSAEAVQPKKRTRQRHCQWYRCGSISGGEGACRAVEEGVLYLKLHRSPPLSTGASVTDAGPRQHTGSSSPGERSLDFEAAPRDGARAGMGF